MTLIFSIILMGLSITEILTKIMAYSILFYSICYEKITKYVMNFFEITVNAESYGILK